MTSEPRPGCAPEEVLDRWETKMDRWDRVMHTGWGITLLPAVLGTYYTKSLMLIPLMAIGLFIVLQGYQHRKYYAQILREEKT